MLAYKIMQYWLPWDFSGIRRILSGSSVRWKVQKGRALREVPGIHSKPEHDLLKVAGFAKDEN